MKIPSTNGACALRHKCRNVNSEECNKNVIDKERKGWVECEHYIPKSSEKRV